MVQEQPTCVLLHGAAETPVSTVRFKRRRRRRQAAVRLAVFNRRQAAVLLAVFNEDFSVLLVLLSDGDQMQVSGFVAHGHYRGTCMIVLTNNKQANRATHNHQTRSTSKNSKECLCVILCKGGVGEGASSFSLPTAYTDNVTSTPQPITLCMTN